ncbi:unnamed protein product [Heterobilharzia americana]|nr:unnamed protein product [Heterobilharzia americana]
MSEIIGDKTLKSTHKPTFTHYNNYTTHNGNSSQRGIDYAAANELPTINNDRLLITNISRERASSFQESNKVNREYVYQKNEQDVCNSKTLLYNPNNTSNNISHGRHVNVMYKSTERSVNPTHLKQSHSFKKYRLTHTLSEENRTNIMPLTLNKMNPPQSLRQIISLKKCLQMPTESSYNQHTNYELQNKRGSKYSNMLEPNSSIDCAIFHQPHPSMHSERRYSRHLKPLDAWQSRQSHSMEIVNTTAANQRSLSSPQKRGPLSKQTAIRKLPPIYSRSLQHSTCSFPVHWGGFLSGPTLSLTSAFDSSISLDSHEPIQPILLLQQQLQQRSQQSYRGKFSASKEHAYSASESPQNLIPLEESLTNSRHIKSLHQSRINLSPSSYSHHNGSNLTQPITRKVHSFELNSNPRYQQLLPELVRNNSVLLKVNDIHQLGHSTHSSRRGSSNSNNSVFLSKEWKYSKSKLSSEFSPVQNPISPYSNDNNNNNDKIVQQLIPQNCTAKPLEKLIPPDLIFSPASRRASMMDEDISGVQNSMLNVTGDLKEFYLNNLEYNDNNNTNSTTNATETNILIEPLHHQNYSEINFPKNRNNTNSFAKDNTEVNKLMPTHSYESDGQKYSSPNHYCLRYGRHKSADTFVSKNGINTMREFYSHRNSASVHQNTPHLSRTYLKSDQQSLTPPGSQLPVSINNGYRNSSEYQSHLHIACRSQIDMRNIDNGWDTMDRFVNKDSNSNLTNRHQHQAPNFNLTNNSKESYFLNVNDEKDDNVITGKDNNDRSKMRISANRIKSLSDEEFSDRSLPRSSSSIITTTKTDSRPKMKTLQGEDYLFKSTRGDKTNIIDPLLLKPSLGPVIDSSEENTSDPCENDTYLLDRSEPVNISKKMIMKSASSLLQSTYQQRNKSSTMLNTNNADKNDIDSHAARRRRSFLLTYWQQTIQQDDEQSNGDTCNIYESSDDDDDDNEEFSKDKNKSNRYESTGGLNDYRSKHHNSNEIDNDNLHNSVKDSTLLHINRSVNNTRCKSSESGLNYFNNNSSIRNNNKIYTRQEPLSMYHQQQDNHNYHNTRKSRIKSRYQ